jgi:transcription initiation factor TFIIH subunit 2
MIYVHGLQQRKAASLCLPMRSSFRLSSKVDIATTRLHFRIFVSIMALSRRKVRTDADRDDEDTRKNNKGYTWETIDVRSWDQIVEDPSTGRLQSFDRQEQIARKRRRDDGLRGVRRGIIRYSVLILDTSAGMDNTDLKPSRSEVVCAAACDYIHEYFDQNPISQMAIITTRDAVARKLSNMSSNPNQHIDAIQEALRLGPYGDASLQNALDLARALLGTVPAYGTREVLVAFGSLSTCDPGNIHTSIGALVPEKIRCSAVGLGAELHILRAMTETTSGSYFVAMNEEHFGELLRAHVVPPPTTSRRVAASLIRMGFPILRRLATYKPCINNIDLKRRVGYQCPRCAAWLSEMPCECTLCGLMLVSSPHLARSYHHLFPVPKYNPVTNEQDASVDATGASALTGSSEAKTQIDARCTGCLRLLPVESSLQVQCPKCKHIFCVDCDTFVHDALHHCPGCGAHNETSVLAGAGPRNL